MNNQPSLAHFLFSIPLFLVTYLSLAIAIPVILIGAAIKAIDWECLGLAIADQVILPFEDLTYLWHNVSCYWRNLWVKAEVIDPDWFV